MIANKKRKKTRSFNTSSSFSCRYVLYLLNLKLAFRVQPFCGALFLRCDGVRITRELRLFSSPFPQNANAILLTSEAKLWSRIHHLKEHRFRLVFIRMFTRRGDHWSPANNHKKRATNGRPYKQISAKILFSLPICVIMGSAKSLPPRGRGTALAVEGACVT